MRSGMPSTSTGVGGLERADDERDEVRAHHHRVGEADGDLAAGPLAALDLGAVGDGQQRRVDDERDRRTPP